MRALLPLLLLLPATARAAPEPRPVVAVFDFEAENVLLDARALAQLTDELVVQLTGAGFTCVPREVVRQRLLAEKTRGFRASVDEASQLELGRELAAQKTVVPQVAAVGDHCRVRAVLFDLTTSSSERAASLDGAHASALAASIRAKDEEIARLTENLERLRLQRVEGLRPSEAPARPRVPLPAGAAERYRDLVSGAGPPAERLVEHEGSGISLTRHDMATLAPGAWLNDEVINLSMALLQARDAAARGGAAPRTHFFPTFFCNKLYKDGGYDYAAVRRWTLPKRLKAAGQPSQSVLDCDRIVVPVHQGIHWTCAVVDLEKKELRYYDALLVGWVGRGTGGLDLDALTTLTLGTRIFTLTTYPPPHSRAVTRRASRRWRAGCATSSGTRERRTGRMCWPGPDSTRRPSPANSTAGTAACSSSSLQTTWCVLCLWRVGCWRQRVFYSGICDLRAWRLSFLALPPPALNTLTPCAGPRS